MEVGKLKGNIGEIYILSTGEIRDTSRLDNFYPNSNVDMLIINIEDGGGENSLAQINYTPPTKLNWGSTWFPLTFRGIYPKKLKGDTITRSFAQYITYVPSLVSGLNLNNESSLQVAITFRQVSGSALLGVFNSIYDLEQAYEPTQELSTNLSVVYVYDGEDSGFYQVQYNDAGTPQSNDDFYEWVKVDRPIARLERKSYDIGYISIQGGYGGKAPIQQIEDFQYHLIWEQLYTQSGDIRDLITQIESVYVMFDGENNIFVENTSNMAYTLEHSYDSTFKNPIRNLFLTIPNDTTHGFWSGVNFETSSDVLGLNFINNTNLTLKVIKYDNVFNYLDISPNKVYNLTFYCDGINIYCYYLEVEK